MRYINPRYLLTFFTYYNIFSAVDNAVTSLEAPCPPFDNI